MIRTSGVVVSLCILWVVLPRVTLAAQDHSASRADLPANIRVEPMLHSIVADLLRKSPTFRRQCLTIASARAVRVIIRVAPPRLASGPRAHATLTRYDSGLLRAEIEIPVAGDYVELLPHELEHVIESIEGLDLARLADAGEGGVANIGDAFETGRAKNAGLAASREVYGELDPGLLSTVQQLGRIWRAIRARAVPPASQPSAGPASRR